MEEKFADVLQETVEKKKFVETVLQDVIKAAYPHVKSLVYENIGSGEYVAINFRNYAPGYVCVDCDSLGAIIKDVIRKLDRI